MLGLLNLINQANALGILNHHKKISTNVHHPEMLAPPLKPSANDVIVNPQMEQGYYSGPMTQWQGDEPQSMMPSQIPEGNYPMMMIPQTPIGYYEGFDPTSYSV